MPTKVLLADDHAIVRQGVRVLLEREGFEIIGEAGDGQEALNLARSAKPEIAVLDFAMPVFTGVEVANQLRAVSPDTRCVLLTMHREDRYVLSAMQAGVRGYVLKAQAGLDLVRAVREVGRGGFYLSPGISETVVDAYLHRRDVRPNPLTDRERLVLQLVAEGRTTKEIAAQLKVSVKSAESYRTRLMQKLEIHHTAGLVRYAIREGLVQP